MKYVESYYLIVIVVLVTTIVLFLIKERRKNASLNEQISKLSGSYEELKNNTKERIKDLEKENHEIKSYYREALRRIDSSNKIINEQKENIDKQIALIDRVNAEKQELVNKNREFQSELRFYTDIKEESLKLNDLSRKDFRITIDPQTLNEEQKHLYSLMNESNDNMFITGKAGTGKSYLLRCFKDNTTKRVLYCAPTGVAAININAVTIHSAFGFQNINKGAPFKIGNNTKTLLENIDAVVIDEISMVRSDYFARIDEMMKMVRNSNLPFGGVQMIIIGDVFQLPPVVRDGEIRAFLADNYNGIYFFNTDAYKKGGFICYELQTIVRQNDKEFIEVLNVVREGSITQDQIEYLNKRYVDKLPNNSRIIRVVPTKRQASEINNMELSKIKSKEYIFEANVLIGGNKLVENEFPCDFKLKLKLGCLVMMLINDNQEKRYVNGTLGIISGIDNNIIKVSIDGCEYEISRVSFSKSKVYYDREKKEIVYENEVVVMQFPLIPAYALTVHKSQGATYQTVAIDVNNTFETGQTYVSLSRCANFDKLYLLSKITPDTILVDNEVVNFYKHIKQNNEEKEVH